MSYWQKIPAGYRLNIRLTPKASRNAILGAEQLDDGRAVLKAAVRAVPEDGKANAALLDLLADALDVPKSALTLERGATARLKSVSLGTMQDLATRLEALGRMSKGRA